MSSKKNGSNVVTISPPAVFLNRTNDTYVNANPPLLLHEEDLQATDFYSIKEKFKDISERTTEILYNCYFNGYQRKYDKLYNECNENIKLLRECKKRLTENIELNTHTVTQQNTVTQQSTVTLNKKNTVTLNKEYIKETIPKIMKSLRIPNTQTIKTYIQTDNNKDLLDFITCLQCRLQPLQIMREKIQSSIVDRIQLPYLTECQTPIQILPFSNYNKKKKNLFLSVLQFFYFGSYMLRKPLSSVPNVTMNELHFLYHMNNFSIIRLNSTKN